MAIDSVELGREINLLRAAEAEKWKEDPLPTGAAAIRPSCLSPVAGRLRYSASFSSIIKSTVVADTTAYKNMG